MRTPKYTCSSHHSGCIQQQPKSSEYLSCVLFEQLQFLFHRTSSFAKIAAPIFRDPTTHTLNRRYDIVSRLSLFISLCVSLRLYHIHWSTFDYIVWRKGLPISRSHISNLLFFLFCSRKFISMAAFIILARFLLLLFRYIHSVFCLRLQIIVSDARCDVRKTKHGSQDQN